MKADLELVAAVKAGDPAAFSELVIRHQRALLRLVLRWMRDQELAEDVVQETFVKAYQKIHLFEERSSFKSWLFRIGINTAQNHLRSQRTEVDLEKVNLSVEAGAEKNLVFESIRAQILREVKRLPDRQRMALTLRVFEDMDFSEIAKIMDCPYDTAKANYRHALMKLKQVFSDCDWLRDIEEFESVWLARIETAEVDS